MKDNVLDNYDFSKDEELIFKGKDNCYFHLTNSQNEIEMLKGNKNNSNKFSIIDLGKCDNLLKDYQYLKFQLKQS